jgi:RNA polymerase sigma-70 factor (family 1)
MIKSLSSDLHYIDKELVSRISRGDRLAFKILHDTCWNDIYSVALGFLKSPDWVQDVIQDVFMKLWLRREKLGIIDDLKAYIFIMARNELITAIKRKSRLDDLNRKYMQPLTDEFMLPDEALDLKELESAVAEAVSCLPELQQKIFRLTRSQGLSHEEIAGRLGIARKTVANNITRTLNHIRTHLHKHRDEILSVLLISCLPYFS